MLSRRERQQILEEWNGTEREKGEATVPELFAEQARWRGKETAVVCGGRRLSYEELNERSERVAERLRGAGVGLEDVVGMVTKRSEEMVVGLLGVLKAGAAYLPLDPKYPQERLQFMVEDAGACYVLEGWQMEVAGE